MSPKYLYMMPPNFLNIKLYYKIHNVLSVMIFSLCSHDLEVEINLSIMFHIVFVP